jgi:ornithine--oxo-acid transaminase
MYKSADIIAKTEKFGAHNYSPKPVVIEKASGALAYSPEGKRYFDMLSAYSALNLGHCHPEIVQAAKEQLEKVTLTSRAFHNSMLGDFYEKLSGVTGKEMVLPMNTGAEAVETAIKAARRWGNFVKGVQDGEQEIIVCAKNFHGRTTTIISFSSDLTARRGFAPFTPGFKVIPYGEIQALENAITKNTVAFLVEPIQGEAGVIVPPEGYLKAAREVCSKHNVLLVADEVQTGFARTGTMFTCNRENVIPDIYVLGKALGGGILPVSAIAADKDILGLFDNGSHGSTFGGNPFAAAVASKTIDILVRDDYPRIAEEKGKFFFAALHSIKNTNIKEIRGKGLLIGVEFNQNAAPYVKKLIDNGVLAKETNKYTVRFAPPLVISSEELSEATEIICKVFSEN